MRKRIELLCATVLFFAATALFLSSTRTESVESVAVDVAKVSKPVLDKYGLPADTLWTVRDEIRRNETLSVILSRHNVPPERIRMVTAASEDVFDVRRLRSGKEYQVYMTPDSSSSALFMVYESNRIEYVVFDLGDPVQVYTAHKEVEIAQRGVAGTIEGSLYSTLARNDGAPEVATRLSQVFAWQIDFHRLRRGDELKVIYEDNVVDGTSVGVGLISAAYIKHAGHDYYAFYFEQDGAGEYFDEEGNSLRKAFLKAPLKYTRISSRYSPNRLHPILRVNRPHLGTDYAAPAGTPIMSVGDGVVTEAGYTRGNGRYVRIRHNATYQTQYLHMSRFANGIHRGARVEQGDVIGYVGQTGLATGPHLCYRFWKNGRQVDPFALEMPSSDPVSQENMPAFEQMRDGAMRELMRLRYGGSDSDARSRAV